MLTIADLVEYLKGQRQDIQVIWGWSKLPPWELEASIDDLPMSIEWIPLLKRYVLFLPDFGVEDYCKDVIDYQKNLSGWEYLKLAFVQWRKGFWYRKYRLRHYSNPPKYIRGGDKLFRYRQKDN